jgi:hypothetical protein
MGEAPDSGPRPPGEKRYDPAKVRLARLSWPVPLACLGVALFVNAVRVQQPANRVAGWIGAAGFVLAVSLALSVRYWGELGHAAGGLAASVPWGFSSSACSGSWGRCGPFRGGSGRGGPACSRPRPAACRRPGRSAPRAPVTELGHRPLLGRVGPRAGARVRGRRQHVDLAKNSANVRSATRSAAANPPSG